MSGVAVSFIERLSSQHDWVRRTAEWDREVDTQKRARLLDQVEETNRQHLEIAEVALSKISQQLKNLDPTDFKVQHLPKLLEVVIRMQRLALGEPVDSTQATQLLGAAAIRAALDAAGVLSDPRESEHSGHARLDEWLNGGSA